MFHVSANIEFRKWARECFLKPESVKTVGPTAIAWACHVNYTDVRQSDAVLRSKY